MARLSGGTYHWMDLLSAVRQQESKSVRDLLQNGADIEQMDSDRETALLIAVNDVSNIAMARLLLERGANVNAKGKEGFSALHYAVAGNQPEMIALLLKHGADVEAKTGRGMTPRALAKALQKENDLAVLNSYDAR